MINFDQQVAIITGAGKGLGKAHALALASRGAHVVVNNRRHARDGDYSSADQTVQEIIQAGGSAVANYQDINEPDAGQKLRACALEHFGKIDILILNAAITGRGMFHKSSLADFQQVMGINFFANVELLQSIIPVMREQDYGRILFTISSAGLYGQPGASAYSASKGAMHALMLTLAQENAKHNIHCNALAPFAASQMTEEHMSAQQKDLLNPAKASPMALWLSHPDCSANGQTWIAAGGHYRRAHCMENGMESGVENNMANDLAIEDVETLSKQFDKLSQNRQYKNFKQADLAFVDLLKQLT